MISIRAVVDYINYGLSNPLVLHFRIFGSILSEYSVIRRIWACHGRGSINGRGQKLNIYLKKKIVIIIKISGFVYIECNL